MKKKKRKQTEGEGQPSATLLPRAAVVYLNLRAGSTFPVPDCTLPSSMDRASRGI